MKIVELGIGDFIERELSRYLTLISAVYFSIALKALFAARQVAAERLSSYHQD